MSASQMSSALANVTSTLANITSTLANFTSWQISSAVAKFMSAGGQGVLTMGLIYINQPDPTVNRP